MKYRAEIDGLRALAVLPVILFHAGFEWFSGGFVGVDVFFVISGYLITTIIISEMAESKFSIVNFYERRARRILPALFFVMAACLPFAWLWLTPTDLKDFGQSLTAVSIFSSNILFWWESGYFDTAAELKPLLHTWSLAVEEQYYILFPVFLMLTWRLGIKTILILLSIVFLISLGVAVWGTQYATHPKIISGAFFLLPTRGWELLIGVFVAFYLNYNSHLKSHTINQALSLLGLLMIIYSIIAFDKTTPFPSLYALIPTIGTGLLILCAVSKTYVHKLLSLKFIVGIGLISYSAYLWHQPLLAFARHRSSLEISDFLVIILCVSSLLLAYFSWRYVEAPFRNKQIFPKKNIFLFSITGILFFTSIGFLIHLNEGFTQRIPSNLNMETMKYSPLRIQCHSAEEPCEYFNDNLSWATFGDSHVVELSYALAKSLELDNIGVQHNSYSGCKPSINDITSDCYTWTKKAIERLNNNQAIENIVVSFRLTYYMSGNTKISPTNKNTYSQQESLAIWNNLLSIFDIFLKYNKNVYFVVQPPELPEHIEDIVFWENKDSIRVKGFKRSWWNKRNAFVTERLKDIPELVKIVDTTNIFCDEAYCYGSDKYGYLYFDDNHISVYGASKIVQEGILKN